MQYQNSSAAIGVFTDLDQAQRAVRVLESERVGTSVRLIENDFSETLDNRHEEFRSEAQHKGGVSGFFARLFGFDDDDRNDLRLNSDSEVYFKDSYQKKHHFVIVDNPSDPMLCRDLLRAQGAVIEDRGSELYERQRMETRPEGDVAVMELREEQLNIAKDRVQTGEVHLRKEVIHETKTVEVPVTREEIVIETRPITGAAQNGSINTFESGQTQEIRIPVSEEQIHVQKTVVPIEEVRVSKEQIVENRTVTEDLRHEEARIEEEGRVAISAADRAKLKMKEKDKLKTKNKNYRSDDLPPGI